MKKSTQWLGVFAIGIISAAALSGCSAQDPATSSNTAGTSAGGTGATGGTTGTGGVASPGVQLTGPAAYTVLTGPDATAGATPAPAAWAAKGCSTCHGSNGEGVSLGTTPFGPEIRHVPTTYGTWVVRHGRPSPSPMVAFPEVPAAGTTDISAADLTSILTWLQGQPKPTTGEGLYKDFCGNCHGPKMGTGGVVPVSIVGKKMTDITQKVRMGEGIDPSMRNGYMPAEDMVSLTDAELGLIATFLGATP
jgi:mono/diheme cytochrome c family protein